MRRAAALAAIVSITAATSCASAIRHPAPTMLVVGGVLGFGTCELDNVSVGTCGIIGGSTALFLGGVTALVMLLAAPPPPQTEGEEIEPEQRIGRRHHAPVILPAGSDADDLAPPGAQPATGAGSGSDSGSGVPAGSGS